MKIHSDLITVSDLYSATKAAGMHGVRVRMIPKGSRKRARAFDVALTGTSNRRPNSGQAGAAGDDYAATWDEWGMFIQDLFEADPEAIIGDYTDYENFNYRTMGRFVFLTAPDQHKSHRWEWLGEGGKYQCKNCPAMMRHY